MGFHQRHLHLVHRADAEIGDAVMARHHPVIVQDVRPARHRRRRPAPGSGPDACWRWESPWCGRAHRHARPALPPPTQWPSSRAASSGWACFQQLADQGGGNLLVAGGRDGVEGGDGEAFHLAHIGQRRQVAGAPWPNSKSCPTTTPLMPSASTSTFSHEILRRAALRHLGVEGQCEQRVHAQIRQQPRLGAQRRQAEAFRARVGNIPADAARTPAPPAARLRASACALASAIRARWPRCTPSKLPIATTAPRRPAGTSSKWRKMRIVSLCAAGRRGASTWASDSSTSRAVHRADTVHAPRRGR